MTPGKLCLAWLDVLYTDYNDLIPRGAPTQECLCVPTMRDQVGNLTLQLTINCESKMQLSQQAGISQTVDIRCG